MGNSSSQDGVTSAPMVTSQTNKSLHRSAFFGNNNDIRRTLRNTKGIVNFQDEHGFTALMAASSGGRTETVDILLAAGANPDLMDKNGVTALMCAVQRGHIGIVDRLLDAGARTDLTDNEGCNVFLCAARAGHRNIVSLLLECDKKREDKYGHPSELPTPARDRLDPYSKLKYEINRRVVSSERSKERLRRERKKAAKLAAKSNSITANRSSRSVGYDDGSDDNSSPRPISEDGIDVRIGVGMDENGVMDDLEKGNARIVGGGVGKDPGGGSGSGSGNGSDSSSNGKGKGSPELKRMKSAEVLKDQKEVIYLFTL